jgi:lipoprotein-releasing system ATP-binding protein
MTLPLELKNIEKRFGNVSIFKNLTLKVEEGDFVGIFGPSGSGKTTLLHIAGGLDIPDKGEVYLWGERIDRLSEGKRDKIRRGKVAFIFQFFYLLEDFSVEENLEIFGKLLGVKNVRRKVDEILKLLGLERRRHYKPPRLSGGERQRVAVGRALITGARLILADEPTGNLDERQEEEIFNHFERLNYEGYTFVVVTHNRKLQKFFKRSFYLSGGLLSDKTPG